MMRLCCRLSSDNPGRSAESQAFSTRLSVPTSGSKLHIIKESTPISDQGPVGSCCANATADALEILLGLEGNEVQQLSRLFVYWNARLFESMTNKDEGTLISLAMQSLIDYGVCRESTWQYLPNRVFTQPGILSYKEADDNRINTFYQIKSSGQQLIDEVSTAIRANHPVVFGTAVGQEFMDYKGEDVVLSPPKHSLGNHAMIIIGVDEENDRFLVRNSWGEGWGQGGRCWFSSQYIQECRDLHVPTFIPNLVV